MTEAEIREIRVEAMRAAATILSRALEVEDATTGNTTAAALIMAEQFAKWMNTGEWYIQDIPSGTD